MSNATQLYESPAKTLETNTSFSSGLQFLFCGLCHKEAIPDESTILFHILILFLNLFVVTPSGVSGYSPLSYISTHFILNS